MLIKANESSLDIAFICKDRVKYEVEPIIGLLRRLGEGN